MKKYILIIGLMISWSAKASDEITIVAQTDPNDASTKCGDDCTWKLYSDGRFEITGTGAMYNYRQKHGINTNWVVDGSPWDDYIDQIKSVDISHGITTVGNGAFKGALNLKNVQIPEGVVSIGNGSFMSCQMPEIKLPDSLKKIDDFAFSVNVFSKIDIPVSVEEIGQAAFWDTRIGTLVLPDLLKSMASDVFYASTVNTIVISDKLSNIDQGAFKGANYLQSIYCTGDVDVCKTNVGEAFADKVKKATTKQINGVTYIIDNKGKIVATSGHRTEKRIYTIDEANQVAGKINSVSIRYR